MSGLLGWIDGTAHLDAAETLDSMAQAAHVGIALTIGTSSSPATLTAWQTHDPVNVLNTGSIIAVLLTALFWLYRCKADIPDFLLTAGIACIGAVYFNNYPVRYIYFPSLLLDNGGNGIAPWLT